MSPSMEAAAASSSTKPPLLPLIFLSHSGQQKGGFVTFLDHALRNAGHRPFIDTDIDDSLPLGHDFVQRLFEACNECKLAVVVLSEDYVKSLWPMLELQHFFLSSSPDRSIYPLFYELKPGDLSNSEKLQSWKAWWAQHEEDWLRKMQTLQDHGLSMGSKLQIIPDIKSWPNILSKLSCRSGSVRPLLHNSRSDRGSYASDREYIEAIVSSICRSFPPPTEYLLEVGTVGQARMQQEIWEVFQQERSIGGDKVSAIGVYGIGGIGKSTLCKMMVNFYGSEFPGRCFYLELPSHGDDVQKVLHGIKEIARIDNGVTNIDRAMGALQEKLRHKKFFLAIDNIWPHGHTESFEHAKRIMLMEFAPGTKIMLTSRSKEVLNLLLEIRFEILNLLLERRRNAQSCPMVVHVPTLSNAEAVDSLKSRYCRSSFIPEDRLIQLARSCCYGGHCHALSLKLKAVCLEMKGRRSFTDQQWRDLISSLEVRGGASAQDSNSPTNTSNIEQGVLQTVQRSLDAVPADLQDFFIDLATFPVDTLWHMRCDLPTLVRYHYDDCTEEGLLSKVRELEHHGLLEVESKPDCSKGEYYCTGKHIVIHDLFKEVAKSRVLLQHVNSAVRTFDEDLSVVTSTDELLEEKHVSGRNLKASTWRALFGSCERSFSRILTLKRSNPVRVQIRVLIIRSCSLGSDSMFRHIRPAASVPWRWLCLKNNGRDMKLLRVLQLEGIKELREIEGWEGVPNLVVLSLQRLDGLKRIGSIDCLGRLERLILKECQDLEVQALVGAGAGISLVKPGDKLPKLQHLIVQWIRHLTEVGPRLFDAFPALKVLNLEHCVNLESFPDLNSGTLQTLEVCWCRSLKSIEGIGVSSLTALQRLVLRGCSNLRRMSDISKVKSTDLQVLEADGCPSELGNQLRLMMVASCCGHDNRLRELGLSIRIPSEIYKVGCDGINHESSGSSWTSSNSATAAASSSSSSSNIPVLDLDAHLSCDLSSDINCGQRNMAHFVHLQHLFISAELEAEYPCCLRLSGLPPSLQDLTLEGFASVQKLDLRHLPPIRDLRLHGFASVQELVLPPDSQNLTLKGFASVQELDLSGLRPNLIWLTLEGFASVQELDLSVLPQSLGFLHLRDFASVQELNLRGLQGFLHDLELGGFPKVQELHLSGLQCILRKLQLWGFASVKELHLSGLPIFLQDLRLSGFAKVQKLNLWCLPSLLRDLELRGFARVRGARLSHNLGSDLRVNDFRDHRPSLN